MWLPLVGDMRLIKTTVGLSLAILIPQIANAQISYPMVMSLSPIAAQTGTSSEVVIESRYSMFGANQILVTGEGVVGEVVTPMELDKDGKEPSLTKIKVKFTVAEDASEGVREIRVVTPVGASTVGQLVVTRDPVVQESDKNNTRDQALPFSAPAMLCGRIESNEDVDYFRFHLDEPKTLTFFCQAMVLEDRIHDLQQHVDPIVTIRNASGSTVAAGDNFYAADPLFSHHFEEPGDYFVEVRDVRYQGNRYWEYAINVHDRPHLITVHPLAVTPGATSGLKLIGHHLGESPTVDWTVPQSLPLGMATTQLPIGDSRTNPTQLFVTTETPVVESLEANETFEQATPVPVPGIVCGQIETEADLDLYKFDAKKGERFSFEVISRRLGTSLDPIVNLVNSEGKSLSENDDLKYLGRMTSPDAMIENWTVPADGTYAVQVRDVHLRGGEEFPYILKIQRAEPDFELVLDSDKTLLSPGMAGALFARVVRKNGFDGPVQLSVEGLPHGVTATCGDIPPNLDDGCIVLQASPDTNLGAANISVLGKATIGEAEALKEVSVAAQSMQETYMPGGGRSHFPVAMHTVTVGKPLDLKAVRVEPQEVALKPGESVKLNVEIDRAEGFDKNVTLDLLFQHLSSKYAVTLPKGVAIDLKQSKTLLTGKETKGHLTLTAAKDAPPIDKQVCSLMANVSINFVMKATYSSPPVLISVSPQEGQ